MQKEWTTTIFARKAAASEIEPTRTGDPYFDARNVWLERYGTYVSQAYNWRLLAILEAIALTVAIVGILYLASQTKFVPYVVAIDKLGAAVAVRPADKASTIDERVVRAQLADWLVGARSVVTDRIVELDRLQKVFALVAPDSEAFGYLQQWYPNGGHSPLDRAKSETDSIAINAVLPISPNSYDLQWTETIRDLHGRTKATQTWSGTATVGFRAPTDEAVILKNPLGLYITSLNWTQKI